MTMQFDPARSGAENYEPLREAVQRLRRMETRQVKMMQHLNIPTETENPQWINDRVQLPSMSVSMRDLLAAVPEGWPDDKEVKVYHKGAYVASLYLSAEN